MYELNQFPIVSRFDVFCLYMHCRASYEEGRVVISLTCLILPHVCVCPKPRPAFSTAYVVVFFHCSQ